MSYENFIDSAPLKQLLDFDYGVIPVDDDIEYHLEMVGNSNIALVCSTNIPDLDTHAEKINIKSRIPETVLGEGYDEVYLFQADTVDEANDYLEIINSKVDRGLGKDDVYVYLFCPTPSDVD